MTKRPASTPAGPVAIAGVGAMGRAMAGVLIRAGMEVRLWNRTASTAAAAALGAGATAADTPAAAARRAAYAIANLSSDDALRTVCLGPDGLIAGLGAGGLLIDMGTSGASATAEIATAARAAGVAFADAPVSGGQAGAEAGALSIMYGCAEADIERLAALFALLGDRASRIGEVGAGQVAKAANQLIVGVTIEAVAAALALAEASGVDPALVRDALRGGFADSRILDLHGARMIAGDTTPGARCSIMEKDLGLIVAAAEAAGLDIPVARRNAEQWAAMAAKGWADLDHSALFQLYRRAK